MADVKIRNLDDHLVETYRQRAEAGGISLEEELRRALRDNLLKERRAWADRLMAAHAEFEAKYGILPDSTPGIRAERDGEPDA
jgi:plasmid stability protein